MLRIGSLNYHLQCIALETQSYFIITSFFNSFANHFLRSIPTRENRANDYGWGWNRSGITGFTHL